MRNNVFDSAISSGVALSPMCLRTNASPGHFTANLHGDYVAAASVGFNLMDVSSKSVMESLPVRYSRVILDWRLFKYDLRLFAK